MTTTKTSLPPRWDLSNVYPGLDSEAFKRDFEMLGGLIDELDAFLTENSKVLNTGSSPEQIATTLAALVDKFNAVILLADTLEAYIYSFIATDSYNDQAKRLYSEFQQVDVRLWVQRMRFQSFLGTIASRLPEVLVLNPTVQDHAFILNEYAEQSQYLMSEAEESLAADLSLSGINAWSKLQGTVTSQLSVEFELDGEVQKLPMPALVNLRSHPDGEVRRRAYLAQAPTHYWRASGACLPCLLHCLVRFRRRLTAVR
jgi:oligoendopeptidase F